MSRVTHRGPPPGRGPTWVCEVCGKRAYATWRHARNDARAQRRRYTRRRRGQPYWSRICHCFHVGSLPRKDRHAMHQTSLAPNRVKDHRGRLSLRNLRHRANLTVDQAAAHLGVSPEYLRAVESGQRPLPPVRNREEWIRFYRRQIRLLARMRP